MNTVTRVLSICFVLALLMLAGCASINVNYDYDTSTNFAGYRSFAWAPDPAKATTPMDANDAANRSGLLSNRIKSSVNRALEAKGLTQSSDNPDLLAVYHIGVQDKIQVTDWGYRYSDYYWGYGGRQMDVYQYQEGRLIIDLVDAETHNLVWRGTGEGIVNQVKRSPEEMQVKIDDVVNQIMSNYPPPLP